MQVSNFIALLLSSRALGSPVNVECGKQLAGGRNPTSTAEFSRTLDAPGSGNNIALHFICPYILIGRFRGICAVECFPG
jgi:hypothetical protein